MKFFKICLALIFFSLTQYTIAQVQNFNWVDTFEGSNVSRAITFDFDNSGNFVIAGIYNDTLDCDPSSANAYLVKPQSTPGIYNGYVAKYNSLGNLIWYKNLEGQNVSIFDIKIDAQNKIHILGLYIDSIDFDPGIATRKHYADSARRPLFLLTLDNNGNYDNVKTIHVTQGYSRTKTFVGFELALNNNSFYIQSKLIGEVLLDSVTNLVVSNNNINPYMYNTLYFKLDRNKNLLWHKQIPSKVRFLVHTKPLVDDNGNLIVIHNFNDSITLDPSLPPLGINFKKGHILVSKIDSNGNYLWAKSLNTHSTFPAYEVNFVEDFEIDAVGNIYLIGYLKDTLDVNPDPNVTVKRYINPSEHAVFLIKLDKNGNYIWDKIFKTSLHSTLGFNLTVVPNNIIVSKAFFGSFTLDTNSSIILHSNSNGEALFNAIFDSSGAYKSHKFYKNTKAIWAYEIKYNNNALFTLGGFSETIDFNPPNNTNRQIYGNTADSYLLKTTICETTTDTITVYECANYTLPSGNAVITSSGQYTDSLLTVNGCDSVLTINLNIGNVDTTYTVRGSQIQSNAKSKNYQWLNCNNGYSILLGETNRNFIAITTGDYAVEITDGNCVDTTNCVPIIITGIAEANFSSGLNAFPNPTTNNTTIYFEEQQEFIRYTIRSISGKLIKSGSATQLKTLPLELNVAEGVYFVRIINDNNESAVVKIIKYK
jgi:hypothetical protein